MRTHFLILAAVALCGCSQSQATVRSTPAPAQGVPVVHGIPPIRERMQAERRRQNDEEARLLDTRISGGTVVR